MINESIYIFSHTGMGDYILCNAIFRYYAEIYKDVFFFSNPLYYENNVYMFRDKENIHPINDINNEIWTYNQNKYKNKLIIGLTSDFTLGYHVLKLYRFDEGYYNMAKIPLQSKWNLFYLKRDIEKEKEIFYNIFKLSDYESFLFVHDDNKYKIKNIDTSIKIINPSNFKNINIFNFIYTIEKAKEVHVMNSSFAALIDTMQLRNDNIFYHDYVRNDRGDCKPKYKLNWKIIN